MKLVFGARIRPTAGDLYFGSLLDEGQVRPRKGRPSHGARAGCWLLLRHCWPPKQYKVVSIPKPGHYCKAPLNTNAFSEALTYGNTQFYLQTSHTCLYSPAAEHQRPWGGAGTHFSLYRPTITSERLNIGRSNFAVRYIVQKSCLSSKVKMKGQRSRSPGTKNEKLLSHPH